MLTSEQLLNRIDQLSTLKILPPMLKDRVKLKFSKEFINDFVKQWDDSISKSKMEFQERLQVISAITLTILYPELNKDDLYELSQVCLFIWIKFYKINEQEYEKFLESKKTGLDVFE